MNKKMIAVMMAMLLLLSACAQNGETAKTEESKAPLTQETSQTQANVPENKPAEKPSVPETPANSENKAESSSFDAEAALTIEEQADSVKYIFHTLPQNAEELQALIEKHDLSNGKNTAAYLMVSLVRYIESEGDGHAMIDILRGPRPMSDTDKSFLKERFSDKKYLPMSYFQGAKAENNYMPEEPWSIVIYDDPVSAEDGYYYVHTESSGAENRRRVVLRVKDGQHYLWEYNGVMLSIQQPASEDPWL